MEKQAPCDPRGERLPPGTCRMERSLLQDAIGSCLPWLAPWCQACKDPLGVNPPLHNRGEQGLRTWKTSSNVASFVVRGCGDRPHRTKRWPRRGQRGRSPQAGGLTRPHSPRSMPCTVRESRQADFATRLWRRIWALLWCMGDPFPDSAIFLSRRLIVCVLTCCEGACARRETPVFLGCGGGARAWGAGACSAAVRVGGRPHGA